jgi:NO-binding membrane sensor protein with MHYT domain
MDFKALLADQLGHFTPYDIGTALISLFAAALLAYAVGLLAKAPAPKELSLSAAVMAFAVSLVRASVPLSIALVAAALLLRGEVREADKKVLPLRLAALAIGLGCGSSASLIVGALVVPLGLLLRWGTSERS